MRRIASRKFREAAIHEYRFIICDGNGESSRGNEDNGYFERIVDASNLKSAVTMIFRYLNYDRASLKNYLDIYYGDDPDNEKPEFKTGKEILDWVEEHNRVNWEPWVEGYAIDDKIIKDPSQMRKVIYESRISRVTADSYFAIDYDFWGVKFYDEEEDGELDYTWGYIPTYEEMSHKFPDLGTAAIVATVNYLTSELAKASQEKGNFLFKDKVDFEKCTPQMMISILKEVRKSLLSGRILTHYELRDRRTKLEAVDEAIECLQNSKNEDLEEAKRMTARRFREERKHTYSFLIEDDNEEQTHGMEDNNIFQVNVSASDFRKAVEQIFHYFNEDGFDLDEYLEYYADDGFASLEDTGTTGEDLLDFIEDNSESWDPHVLGYAIDGEVEFLSEDAYFNYHDRNGSDVGLYKVVRDGKDVDVELWESYIAKHFTK